MRRVNRQGQYYRILSTSIRLLIICFFVLTLLSLGGKPAAAKDFQDPIPEAIINLQAETFLGTTFTFDVVFDNTSSDLVTGVGFGPYLDVFLPTGGVDGMSAGGPEDGISFNSAQYQGFPVQVFPVIDCFSGTQVAHPLTNQLINCPAAPGGMYAPFHWQMVVVELPFGSFSIDQPPAPITFSATLSDYADLSVPLPVVARAGFRFGQDPLDNPVSDPVVVSGDFTQYTEPVLLRLIKQYNWREDETSTGPNFTRSYTVNLDIAEGQVLNNVTLSDLLPAEMQYVALTAVNPGAVSCSYPDTAVPGGTLSCSFSSVTGGAGAADGSLTFSFYVPLLDAGGNRVIDPNSGGCVDLDNAISAQGTWDPIDDRDSEALTDILTDPAHTLEACSHTVQKSNGIVTDITPAGLSPYDTLEYTLDFQVSDFFAENGIVLTDVISDGLRFDSGFTPTLSINGHTFTLATTTFDSSNYSVIPNYTPASPAPNDGSTQIIFRVSDELTDQVGFDLLRGGCVPAAGVADPNCSSPDNDGPTTGVIRYRVQVQKEFSDTYPSGDPSVDQGDVLSNSVVMVGNVLDTLSLLPTGGTPVEDSQSSVSIQRGNLTKTIYAINGDTGYTSPVLVAPGDAVTYRLQYALLTSDVEKLRLVDYLPLPVFAAGEVTTFNDVIGPVPAAGTANFGPADTFRQWYGTTPALNVDATNNSVEFYYGDFDIDPSRASLVDILFTVTVSDRPFADGLYLTNQVQATEGATNADPQQSTDLIQIQLAEPVVSVTKGVVWSDRSSAVFTPDPAAPVTFNAPGACPRFSGSIDSLSLAGAPIDSDVSGLDAGDLVTFAIVVENTGRSSAFDVTVKDNLPAGLVIPSGGLDLCVTDGNGTALTYSDLGGGLFGSGIRLEDGTTGALTRGKDSSGTLVDTGTNIAVVTFNLQLNSSVEPPNAITNTAVLINYAGTEGGEDHTATDLDDDAVVDLLNPTVLKTMIGTNQAHTTDPNVTIGELVDYSIAVTVPEGTLPNARVTDTLPSGLAFVDCLEVTAPASVFAPAQLAALCNDPTNPTVAAGGVSATWDLGTIVNTDTDNSVAEVITIKYRVAVTNVAANAQGATRVNQARFEWDGGSVTDAADPIRIVEPQLQIGKTVLPTTGDAGNSVEFTIVLQHAAGSGADAFNVNFTDAVPTGLTFSPGTFSITGYAPTSSVNTPPFSATWDSFPLGSVATIKFSATLDSNVSPGQVITNTAYTNWSSLPGNVTATQSPYSALAVERTGFPADPGGSENDYTRQSAANVTVNVPTPVKSLVSTSEAHTTGSAVTVGEVVRYRLAVQIPEGEATLVTLQDLLPVNGLYMDGTARFTFVSNGAGITSSLKACTNDAGASATLANLASNLVDCTFDAGMITGGPFVSGTDPTFAFGNLVNLDRDDDGEFLVVEFNMLLMNTTANQLTSPATTRANQFRLYVNSVLRGTSNSVSISVTEPVLTVAKALVSTPLDAKDPFSYSVTVRNPGPITAFDIRMVDAIPLQLNLLGYSDTRPATSAITADTSTATQVDLMLNQLQPGEEWVITLQVEVKEGALVGLTIANSANIRWTSLPGDNGTVGNSTGSTAPGTPGSATGERDGSGGTGTLNDYTASDPENLTLVSPAVQKFDPIPAVATIGDLVNYLIEVSVPEGTVQDLVVTDLLPAGLRYENYAVLVNAGDGGGVLTETYGGTVTLTPTVVNSGGSGDDVRFEFGDVVTTGDNNPGNNRFLIQVAVRVLNEIGNVQGTVLANTARMEYTNPNDGSTTQLNTGPRNLSLVEPQITLLKSVVPTSGIEAGDTLTYTLQISNTGASTAYDVFVEDQIPAGLGFDTGSQICNLYNAGVLAGPIGAQTSLIGSVLRLEGSPTDSWDLASTDPDTYIECTYTATVLPELFLSGTHINVADADWGTQDGSANPDERNYVDAVPYPVDQNQDQDSASVSGDGPIIEKSVDRTVVTIGDTVTYTLTVTSPLGTARNLVIEDVLPAGMLFNAAPVTIDGIDDAGLAFTSSDPAGGTVPVTLTWNFGNAEITKSPATITYTATVANVTTNQSGTTLTNQATLNYDLADGTPAPEQLDDTTVTIVEPQITLVKSVSLSSGVEAGDILTYTLQISSSGASTAYDVFVEDQIPAGLEFNTNSQICELYDAGVLTGPIGAQSSLTGSLLRLEGNPTGSWDLAATDPDTYILCTYTVTVLPDLFLSGTHINLADADWGTQDGSSNPQERNYEDAPGPLYPVDQDQDQDSAPVSGDGPLIEKGVDKTVVTIGETVTYTLTITSPLGTARNLVIEDVLPAGMLFNAAPVTIDGIDTGALVFSSTDPAGGTVPVTLTWDFGDAAISKSPATITYTATAANVAANQAGTTLSNAVSLNYDLADGTPATEQTDATTVTVVEPTLTIDKQITTLPDPLDAGGVVSYSLLVSNPAGINTATAYNVTLEDTLPAALSLQPATVVVTPSAGVVNAAVSISGNVITVTADAVPVGDSIQVVFSAAINDGAPAGSTITNAATVEWSSMPGTPAEERNGDDGPGGTLDDYAAADSDAFTLLDTPEIAKSIAGTSLSDTTLPVVTIGEIVRYRLVVTLPEGLASSVVVSDVLPLGLRYVSGSAVVDRTGFAGTVPDPTVTGGTTDGEDVIFTFGSTVVNGDNDPNNDSFAIEFEAVVLDVAGNVGLPPAATVLTNQANVVLNGGTPVDSNPVDVTVGEPRLVISKVFTPDQAAANDNVTVTLTVQNVGTTPAYDVLVEDSFPKLRFPVIGEGITPSDFTYALVDADPNWTVTYTGGPIPAGGTRDFDFVVTLANDFASGETYLNTAYVNEYSTLPGDDPNERDEPIAQGEDTLTGISPELNITKTDYVDTAAPGDTLIYDLTISNIGERDATGVVVTETVPQGTTFNSASSSAGWSCTTTAGVTTCEYTIGALAASASVTIQFAVTVNDPLGATITSILNTATVADDGTHGADPNLDDNTTSDEDAIGGALPDLTATKAVILAVDANDNDTVSAGDTLRYTVTLVNSGNQDAGNVVFTDTPDANTALVVGSVTTTQGTVVVGNTAGDTTVEVQVGDLAGKGGSVTIVFDVLIADPLPEDVVAVANQGLFAGDNFEDTPTDDPASTPEDDPTITVLDTAFSKRVVSSNQEFTPDGNVAIGEIVTYEVRMMIPPTALQNVRLVDELSAGLSFVRCVSITPGDPALATNVVGGFDAVCAAPVLEPIPATSTAPEDMDRKVTFALGTLTNGSADNVPLTFTYEAVVLNSAANQDGVQVDNAATWTWDGGSLTTSAQDQTIVEPDLAVLKSVDAETVLPGTIVKFTLKVWHTKDSRTDAFNVVLTDKVPSGLTYVTGSLKPVKGPVPTLLDEAGAPTLTVTWDSFPLASEPSVVEFKARVGNLGPGTEVVNNANVAWTSLPGDEFDPQTRNPLSTERFYDPASTVNIYGARSSAAIRIPNLPKTGFAPGKVTPLGAQPAGYYQDLGDLWLEIPALNVKEPILGVPGSKDGWDLTWLGESVGYLNGTAFPTWEGNTGLTAHVYNADGSAGPFQRLHELRWGDVVILHGYGQRYVYEVRENVKTWEGDLSPLREEKLDWITLITCQGYDETINGYIWRVAVRAVLVRVEPE